MIATKPETERVALDALLGSGLFASGSNADRFLRYVCGKYFDGAAASVSEYSIGVEALGRSQKFDPRQDAIVRVEAHRVRHRLREYYEGRGADDPVHVVLSPGKYVPEFVTRSVRLPEPPASPPKPKPRRIPVVAVLAALLAILVAAVLWLPRRSEKAIAPAPVFLVASGDSVRISAGATGGAYKDSFGNVWQFDRFFHGGEQWAVPYRRIRRTADSKLFFTMRQGRDFGYDIPLKPGIYELRLLFAETVFGEANVEDGGESSRMFDVTANGSPILTDFDPMSDADGDNTADIRAFKDIAPASDGYLHLRFVVRHPVKGNAFVNAIELTPGIRGAMRPLRWVAANHPFEDSAGTMWMPDQFFLGGRFRSQGETITAPSDPEIFRSERFGHFSYAIPVAQGTYELELRFAETWFGTQASGGPGSGSGARLFDVYCNGVALLRNFDIAKEAGGPDRGIRKVFHALRPNAQGKLLLSFVPDRNYACVNAIEVSQSKP